MCNKQLKHTIISEAWAKYKFHPLQGHPQPINKPTKKQHLDHPMGISCPESVGQFAKEIPLILPNKQRKRTRKLKLLNRTKKQK